MPLQAILDSLSHHSWLNDSSIMMQHQAHAVLTKSQSRSLHNKVQKALEVGDSVTAANYFYVGLMLDESRFLPAIQKDGLLRISRYSYQKDPLVPVVSALMEPGLGLSSTVLEYHQSISHLYSIASSIRKEYKTLEDWLSSEREVGIKSALAAVDFLFLRQMDGFIMGDKSKTSRDPLFFTIEELADGFSSLLALYGNELGDLRGNRPINPDASSEGFYYDMLISAAHLSAFREWEFQVDRMGYRLSRKEGTSEFMLSPPSPEFLRAVEMGFIQSFIQRTIKPTEWINENDHSFREIGGKVLHSLEEAGHIILDKEPFERYRFEFPEPILSMTAQVDEFLREERVVLLGVCQDLLTPIDRLFAFDIGNGLTFRDLFLVSRLMQFIRSIIAAKLLPEVTVQRGVVFQSLIPAFQRDKLIELIGTTVGKDKAEIAIDMLTTDIYGYVDIQYQPLLLAGSSILFPTNVFSNSNVYRNPLMVLGKRLYEDGSVDPLVDSMHRVFEDSGALSRPHVNYSWKGEQGETDLLVLMDNLLFAFEFKNSLLPCGLHELMTSLDYIYIAADQLDRFKRSFADVTFRQWLAKETGMSIDSETHLVTGIVFSNRMFLGLRVNGHPVRGNYELEQFIKEGTIAIGDETHCFWLGGSFTGDELRRFLEEDITYLSRWGAMKCFVSKYLLHGCTVDVERMKLDMIALADHFGFKQAKQMLLEQQAELSARGAEMP